MRFYDTHDSDYKTTVPRHFDNGYLPLLALALIGIVVQAFWIITIEKFYFHVTSDKSCWARRLRARLDNRLWNNRVISYCRDRGLTVFDAADATFSAYVGDVDMLNDLNGAPDGNGSVSNA